MADAAKTLIVDIVLDNSVLAHEYGVIPKFEALLEALKSFEQAEAQPDGLKLGIHTFAGLSMETIKAYDATEYQALPKNGFPLMNRMLRAVTQQTETYIQDHLETRDIDYFRPWLIILSSGLGYDKIDFFETYSPKKKEMQPVIFPFLLSKELIMFDVSKINQIKPFITLKDFDVSAFSNWLHTMIHQRLSIGPDTSMRLSKDMFEGWTQL